MLLQRHAAVAIQHRQQHRHALRVEPLRDATRRAEAHAVDQRLQLDQQRPTAVTGHGDDAAGRRLTRTRQENRGRVTHLAQSLLTHVEKRQLTHRTEAILGGAHVAEAARRVALEIQHRVDQVLERPGTGDRAILGDVTHDHHAHFFRLGETHQLRGALTKLGDCARGGADRRQLHGLDGIDDEQPDALLARPDQRRIEIGVRHHAQVRGHDAKPAGAHADLRRGFLRREIQRGRQVRRRDSRLAAAAWTCRCRALRLARSPNPGSGRRPSPRRAPPFPYRVARQVSGRQVRQASGGLRGSRRSGRTSCHRPLFQRVPARALGALTLPFEGLGAAFGAHKYECRLGHDVDEIL